MYPELCLVGDGAGVPVPSKVTVSGLVDDVGAVCSAFAACASRGAPDTVAMKSLRFMALSACAV
jgi:hypothetical protein